MKPEWLIEHEYFHSETPETAPWDLMKNDPRFRTVVYGIVNSIKRQQGEKLDPNELNYMDIEEKDIPGLRKALIFLANSASL